jgi:hypothetical protein
VSAIHEGIWDLVPADRLLVEAKRWTNRLRFPVMLLFFRARDRFPRVAAELDGAAVAELARALGVPEPSIAEPLLPDAADRTAERQRAEIRTLFGFREASAADAAALGTWLRDKALTRTRDPVELAADAEAKCRALRIEPPTPDRIARIVRTAMRAYEEGRIAAVHARLTPAMRVSLGALLQPAGPKATGDAEDGAVPDGRVDAPLIYLRAGPGRSSVASLREELARLGTIRWIGLLAELFTDWSLQDLEACRQRVAVEAPHELRRHPDAARHVWLAAYVHLRGRAVTYTAAGKAFLDMLGVFAEFKTNLRRELQLEGIKAAKALGIYKGRKPTIDLVELRRLRDEEKLGPTAIARRLGIGRASVYCVLGTHKQPA